jgi:hypothetical protein
MKREEFQAKLVGWQSLGPFGSIQEMDADMVAAVGALGPEGAVWVAEALAAAADSSQTERRTILEFAEVYADRFPLELAGAGARCLAPGGPPLLVLALGSTRVRWLIAKIREIVEPPHVQDDLVVAAASSLGELGGPEARTLLTELQHRPGLSAEALREIEIALQSLERKPNSESRRGSSPRRE